MFNKQEAIYQLCTYKNLSKTFVNNQLKYMHVLGIKIYVTSYQAEESSSVSALLSGAV